MNLIPQLDQYLSVRRSLGYDLRTDERVLRRFARFAEQETAPHIDTALFQRWERVCPMRAHRRDRPGSAWCGCSRNG